MIKFLIKLLFIIFFVCVFVIPKIAFAEEINQFITIVNPVRTSSYNKTPVESLRSEYAVIKNNALSATWLLTYEVLNNPKMMEVVKAMDNKQEIGVFLEVTKNFADDSEVFYHDTGFWYHASSVFLSGYTQEERIKMIDSVFGKFKENLGYYPVSVGSWWTDSYSLSYMKEKYGIVANLGCSDQFVTDGYQIWGQQWQVPYYPSKFHAGVPAASELVKLDIVNIQWAPRDPLNGYMNSLYSTQDYLVAGSGLNLDYFEKLINLYARKNLNQFGQITVGLEGDLDATVYNGEYLKQMTLIKRLTSEKEFATTTMKNFAAFYRSKFPGLSPITKIESQDILTGRNKIVWYQSPNFRFGIIYDETKDETKIFDLRVYSENMQEPYYYSPNRNFNLAINIFPVIDEAEFPQTVKLLKGNKLSDFDEKDYLMSYGFSLGGTVYKDYSAEATHFFKQKRFVLDCVLGKGREYLKKVDYLIPQGEMEALFLLSSFPAGKVLVYDAECLQCEYHTSLKPPAISNKRNYVKIYGKHPIVYSDLLIDPESREKTKKELQKLKVKYIYLVKFEEYQERVPFSPGDLNIEKIFSNANAEIWRVK